MLQIKPALQFSQGRSLPWSGAQLVNCFAEKADGDKRDDFAVMAIPGLVPWATAGSGPIRGGITHAGVPYVVSGSGLYSIDEDGIETLLETIPGSDLVRMASNGSEIVIAAGGVGYVWDGAALTTPLPFGALDVAFIDGYIIAIKPDTSFFFISALNDATTWDPADIASVEGQPGNLVAVRVDHREVQFYKRSSLEFFYNSGAADFPFQRQGNAFVERGAFDRDGIVKIDNSVNFVGDDRIVYRLNDYTPVRISTHAIEYQLRNATFARAFTYDQEGHKHYCVTCDNGTFVYDQATGAWHQRRSWGRADWRPVGALAAYSQVFILDGVQGHIFTPDMTVYSEDDNPISVEIYPPTIDTGDRGYRSMYAFEVLCETGVGNDDVTDPQMMLRYSDDGGRRWSNELWRSLGEVGDYKRRAIWRKLGRFRQRQMHMKTTDAVRRLVISYWADIR